MQAFGTVSPRSLPTTLAAQEKADLVSFARKRLSETNISLRTYIFASKRALSQSDHSDLRET